MQQEFLFELGESGVYQWHHSHWRRLCSPLEIVSCIRLNLPMATPQTWLTIRFELADGSSRQALVLKHVIGGDHFWPLLRTFIPTRNVSRLKLNQSIAFHANSVIHCASFKTASID